MRHPDGSLQLGWKGEVGQAYRINSKKGYQLAQRPQNIPGLKERYKPTFHYIDTTCASPLFEDFSPDHPLTLQGDMYWKQRLCKYAREMIGVFGTEEGVEWAVPYSDYFWSLLTRTKDIFPTFNEVPVPLFETVYGDCVDMHQGDWSMINTPNKVLDHILCAEIPYCVASKYDPSKPWCRIVSASRSGADSIEMTLEWKTYGARPAGDYGFRIQFAAPGCYDAPNVAFAENRAFAMPTGQWPVSGVYRERPFAVRKPELTVPATGEKRYDVYVCMTANADGTGEAIPIRGIDLCLSSGWPCRLQSYIGAVKLSADGSISVSNPAMPDICCFARCDTRPDCSYQNDGLLLNAYRICSPLNRLTANTPMTGHKFLTADRLVERSEFGDVQITVNYGSTAYDTGRGVLPQYGFLVECPTMLAFRADSYLAQKFGATTLAVLRSRDGKPLADSGDTSVYRAYGDTTVTVGDRQFSLQ